MDLNDQAPLARPVAGVKRRTIIKGAAWSVPVIAAASALPTAAASVNPGCNCPDNPAILMDASSWPGGMQQNGGWGGGPFIFASASNALNPGQLEALPDRTASTDLNSYFWIAQPVQVCAGKTYTWTYGVQSSRGDNAAGGGGVEQFMDIGWASSATDNALDLLWTNSFDTRGTSTRHAGAVQILPPVAPSSGGFYGYNGTLGASYTASSVFIASTTGTVYLKLRWTGLRGTGADNDDYGVTSLSLTCASPS